MYIKIGDTVKVYLDLVFILNFFIDYLILFATKKILKNKTSIKRLLLGSLVASTSIFLLLLNLDSLELFLFKVVISILIIYTTFGKRGFLKNISYFYLISIFLGGSLYLLNISFSYNSKGILFINNGLHLNFIVSIIAIPIIIISYVKENKSYKNTYSNILNVKLTINKKTYIMKGMIDTGNHLTDPYKKRPVILINKGFNIKKEKCIYVPYKALNTNGLIKCYIPDKVEVNNKIYNNYLIGISKEKFELSDIDCILPNKLKEELWKK